MPTHNYHLHDIGLDEIDKQILYTLAENSRTAASALSQVVGVTRQAVAERMDHLIADGIVLQYTVSIDPNRLGLPIRAFVAITLRPACSADEERSVIELLRSNPWVMECYRVTGDDYFQVRVIAPGIEALKELVLDLRETGVVQGTRTILALETLFEKRASDLLNLIAPGKIEIPASGEGIEGS